MHLSLALRATYSIHLFAITLCTVSSFLTVAARCLSAYTACQQMSAAPVVCKQLTDSRCFFSFHRSHLHLLLFLNSPVYFLLFTLRMLCSCFSFFPPFSFLGGQPWMLYHGNRKDLFPELVVCPPTSFSVQQQV